MLKYYWDGAGVCAVSNMGQGGMGLGNYLSQEFLLQTARNLRMQVRTWGPGPIHPHNIKSFWICFVRGRHEVLVLGSCPLLPFSTDCSEVLKCHTKMISQDVDAF